MKNILWIMVAWMVVIIVGGCSQSGTQQAEQVAPQTGSVNIQEKIAKTAEEAINFAKTLQTAQQKKDYLMAQAKSLYNSQEFQEVVDIAQHVLSYVDKDATEAKKLLEDAKKQLETMVQGTVDKAAETVKGLQL